MAVEQSGATAEQVWAVEPVLRRVIAARVGDRAAVDDLVQDALEHLLRARGRLAQEMMVPYGVVTARNVAASYARTAARRSASSARMVDLSGPESPDEVVLRAEEQAAMALALARLPEEERARLVAHEVEAVPVSALTPAGSAEGTTRVRLARSRAKLRVEYLLALRGVELPTSRCRPTLLALAGGERERQRSVAAARHLLECSTCASLSEALVERCRGLAVLIPLVAFQRLGHVIKSHPATSGVAAASTAGAVAVGMAVAASGSPPAAIPASAPPRVAITATTAAPARPQPAETLTVDGHGLPRRRCGPVGSGQPSGCGPGGDGGGGGHP